MLISNNLVFTSMTSQRVVSRYVTLQVRRPYTWDDILLTIVNTEEH